MVNTIASYPVAKNPNHISELDMLFKQQSYIWDRSATLQTDCIANQIAMSDLEFYNISELRMLNSGHMSYDEFKNNTVIIQKASFL